MDRFPSAAGITTKRIRIHVDKATDLPRRGGFHRPSTSATIIVNDNVVAYTRTIKKNVNPIWDQTFDLDVNRSSKVHVKIYDELDSDEEDPAFIGEVEVNIADLFMSPLKDEEASTYSLKKPNSAKSVGTLAISLDPMPYREVLTDSPTSGLSAISKTTAQATAEVEKSAEFYRQFKVVLEYLDKVMIITDKLASINSITSAANDVLQQAYKILIAQQTRNDDVNGLAGQMADMLGFLNEVEPLKKIKLLETTVTSMMKQIEEASIFITEFVGNGFFMQIASSFYSSPDKKIADFKASFADLSDHFTRGVNVTVWVAVSHGFEDLRDQSATGFQQLNDRLNKMEVIGVAERQTLAEVPGAWWDPEMVGLPGTRNDTLAAIMRWSLDPEDKPLYWLTGAAGSGKSTVSHTLAQSCQDRLGACFFFNRDINLLNSSEFLATTLARQLSRYNDEIAAAISLVVKGNDSIGSLPFRDQMHQLIVRPLQGVKFPKPVVIILDALDESGNPEHRRPLLNALAAEIPQLPSYVKVFITSRDEPDLRATLSDISRSARADTRSENEVDIHTYLEYRFLRLSKKHPHMPNGWPGQQSLNEIAQRADGLFIWARVACNFIDESYDPDVGLYTLLSSESAKAEGPLDRLYLTVLRGVFPSQIGDIRDHYQHIVGAIVAVKDTLTVKTLDAVLGLQRSNLQAPLRLAQGNKLVLTSSGGLISNLGPILRGDTAEVRVLHPSLIDFLSSEARSQEFRINIAGRNRMLAGRCISRMCASLTRNICCLPSPAKFNCDIQDLEERIRAHIPGDLRYACQFWASHLADAPPNDKILLRELKNFVFQHLLHWLEVMSLLNAVDNVIPMVERVEKWLTVCLSLKITQTDENALGNVDTQGTQLEEEGDLTTILRDCRRFVQQFDVPIRQSAGHIYISAIPFAPEKTLIKTTFVRTLANTPKVLSGNDDRWSGVLRTLEGHRDKAESVLCIAFSLPDGKRLVSGFQDGTIQIWDTISGSPIGDLLRGHKAPVQSVAFSQDGNRLASGSKDGMVQLWDPVSSSAIGGPFVHPNAIKTVAFSPLDENHLVSVSSIGTVQVWDTVSRSLVGEPRNGNFRSEVWSITFSTDVLRRIAFTRNGDDDDGDETLWIQDVTTGIQVALKHSDEILCASFSPDGKQLASGSDDDVVWLWDAISGRSIRKFKCPGVDTLSFSPDGNRLACTSSNDTLRMFDATSGRLIGLGHEGNLKGVSALAFSPDGQRLACSSLDGMVQIWDADFSNLIGEARQDDEVILEKSSITFSPDGQRLVSLIGDSTVQIWDANLGIPIGQPLRGHSGNLASVAFSSDGKQVASASQNGIAIWDARKGNLIGKPVKIPPGHGSADAIVLSPDWKRLALAYDGTVQIWDAVSGEPLGEPLRGHSEDVDSLAFSSDGTRLASVDEDGEVRLWDATSGNLVWKSELTGLTIDLRVVFSHDGKRLAINYITNLCILDAYSGAPIWKVQQGAEVVAFSHDDKRLAAATIQGTVQIWDTISGTPISSPLRAFNEDIKAVCFSHDGKHLAVLSSRTVQIWRETLDTACWVVAIGMTYQPVNKLSSFWKKTKMSSPGKSFLWREGDGGWLFGGGHHKHLFWLPPKWRKVWPPYETTSLSLGPQNARLALDIDDYLEWMAVTTKGDSPSTS